MTILGDRLSREMDAYVGSTNWPPLAETFPNRNRRRKELYKLKKKGWYIPGLRRFNGFWALPIWSLPFSPMEKRLWDACQTIWGGDALPLDPIGELGKLIDRAPSTTKKYLRSLSGKIQRMNEIRRSLGLPDTGQ